jgi:DNA-binding LacI/PurR family transcriptional regulator
MMLSKIREDSAANRKSATLEDVAGRAGVSPMTVSRVIRTPDQVKRATLKKVMQAVKDLNYHPNLAARTLASQRSNTIAVVLPPVFGVFGDFMTQVMRGLMEVTNAALVDLTLKMDKADQGSTYEALYRGNMVDAFIFLLPSPEQSALYYLVELGDVPVVAVSATIMADDLNVVKVNNAKGCEQALDYLAGLGHTRIAHIAGFEDESNYDSNERRESYCRFMAERGLKIPEGYIQYGNFDTATSEGAMKRLLDLAKPPTAVFAGTDLMAIGAMREAQRRGLWVPGDVSVIGFDNIETSALVSPALTTIAQPMQELGRVGGEMALALSKTKSEDIHKQGTAIRVLQPTLVERASCGPCRMSAFERMPGAPRKKS